MNERSDKPSLSIFARQPHGLLRRVLRSPIWLYHHQLGWLFGHRFLLLTHIGRRSGLSRETIIEVMRYDKATDICVVASGWGPRSDWFRNIQHTSTVVVTLGLREFVARAVLLSEPEATRELLYYARHHMIAFRAIALLLTSRSSAGTEKNCRDLAKAIPIVAFHPFTIAGREITDGSSI